MVIHPLYLFSVECFLPNHHHPMVDLEWPYTPYAKSLILYTPYTENLISYIMATLTFPSSSSSMYQLYTHSPLPSSPFYLLIIIFFKPPYSLPPPLFILSLPLLPPSSPSFTLLISSNCFYQVLHKSVSIRYKV